MIAITHEHIISNSFKNKQTQATNLLFIIKKQTFKLTAKFYNSKE